MLDGQSGQSHALAEAQAGLQVIAPLRVPGQIAVAEVDDVGVLRDHLRAGDIDVGQVQASARTQQSGEMRDDRALSAPVVGEYVAHHDHVERVGGQPGLVGLRLVHVDPVQTAVFGEARAARTAAGSASMPVTEPDGPVRVSSGPSASGSTISTDASASGITNHYLYSATGTA